MQRSVFRFFHLVLAALLLLPSTALHASLDLGQYFKDEQGSTNWQYVANFSSGILIIILSLVVLGLLLTWRKAHRANHELTLIRNQLEDRVEQRTAELKASESYVANILRSLPLMLVGLNPKGQITHWNRQAEEIAGVTTTKALGMDLWQIYPTIGIKPAQIEQALNQNEPVYIKQSQSGLYYFNITIYPLQGQDAQGVVILIDDVTQKILAENMLVHNDKIASMGELAATMAHDIHTPLQAILFDLSSFQSLLASGKLMQPQNETGKEIERLNHLLADASEKGRNVAAIINNLLAFSRQRNDKKLPAQVPELLEHALQLANDVLISPDDFRFSNIHIEKHFDDNLPTLPCYNIELQQAFLSLFRHAFDAITEAELRVTPCIRIHVSESYDTLWIRINHNGKTLSDEEQMALFEPFFNNNEASQHTNEAGKRLSFAYFIITEQHQGHMAVTSDLESGTTFHMQLGTGG
ncbi:histidine kinase [Nitrincola sp. A-D6]|uniref:two-component system sensor histidine kinase NtrB n=1 Tax=Nitrincola sp. A-D6 TaxID=1545442 RepID=UPI00051FEF38|nr:ATP-binding protein [Nitrincola sp. A-D6]KGK42705.1 histidine kinase [Nitrincola sp. A-D6]